MLEVGSFEAKTHLPQLLEKAARGETIVITRRGKPIAQLGPVRRKNAKKIAETVDNMLAWRGAHGPVLGKGLTIRQLIEEGRRY